MRKSKKSREREQIRWRSKKKLKMTQKSILKLKTWIRRTKRLIRITKNSKWLTAMPSKVTCHKIFLTFLDRWKRYKCIQTYFTNLCRSQIALKSYKICLNLRNKSKSCTRRSSEETRSCSRRAKRRRPERRKKTLKVTPSNILQAMVIVPVLMLT